MLDAILKKIVGTKNDRELKRLSILLNEVNGFETELMLLSDSQLKEKTPYFKEKLKNGLTLDDILSEAFAVAREARVSLNSSCSSAIWLSTSVEVMVITTW